MPRLAPSVIRMGFLGVAATTLAVVGSIYLVTPRGVATPPEGAYPAWESPRLFTFPGDWSKASPVTVRTIYPGGATWGWLTSPEHPGNASVTDGTPCANCHGNSIVGASSVAGWAGPPADHQQSIGCPACHGFVEQRIERLGQNLVKNPSLEPDPIVGKPPTVDVQVKAAYDAEYVYLWFAWDSARPGILHDLLRWDGQKWVNAGGPRPEAERAGNEPSYEDRLAINLATGEIPAYQGAKADYSVFGCWITCHDRKYLLTTRSELDWNLAKPREQVQAQFEAGRFLDMWMWRGAGSGPLGYAEDNFLLESRQVDRGVAPFRTQTGDTMYDEQKTGFRAIPQGRLEELLLSSPLIQGVNSAPITPDTKFNVGDVIPRQVLRPAEGSAADVLANSRWENGRWVVELRRKLDTGNSDDKPLAVGHAYTIGIAVLQDSADARRHHISFPVTLGMDAPADIVARPVDRLR